MLLGSQRPRLSSIPPGCTEDSDLGFAAIRLAEYAGLVLDDWQRWVLSLAMSERDDLRWVASRVGLVVPRQNGKGSVLEARELAGLFLLADERELVHTAHELKTSGKHFVRMEKLIKGVPELDARVKRYNHTNGKEAIELHADDCPQQGADRPCPCVGGKVINFISRSKGSGRGFSGDLVVIDEAYDVPGKVTEALVPVISARDNPQIWYTTSSADDDAPARVIRRIRERALRGEAERLLYAEWSVPADADPDDRRNWAIANPALGIRMRVETIEDERTGGEFDEAGFKKERLGVWGETSGEAVISMGTWSARTEHDPEFVAAPPFAFALEVDSAGTRASLGAASRRPDGLWHVELVKAEAHTDWIVEACKTLQLRNRGAPIVVRSARPGGAAPTVKALEAAGVSLVKATLRDMEQACSRFEAAVLDDELRHLDDPILAAAVTAGVKQEREDGAWIFDAPNTETDITPLRAVVMALHGLQQHLLAGVRRSTSPPLNPAAHTRSRSAAPSTPRW